MNLVRSHAYHEIELHYRVHPVVLIEGPRQVGKTTLARMYADSFLQSPPPPLRAPSAARTRRKPASAATTPAVIWFDLEDARSRSILAENPISALESPAGLVVIDEVQREPKVMQSIRVLVDRPGNTTRFLLTGSAAPTLIKGASETLAGRVGIITLGGFDLRETGPKRLQQLWNRGGFPRSFLAETDESSARWRRTFIDTFLERDMPQFGVDIPATTLRRFWTMIAHFHANIWNAAELARSLGASEPTARKYLDILSDAFVVRQLLPWFENVARRQVKAPKVYVRDSGLLHSLLGIDSAADLLSHPKLGASWEGFVIEQILQLTGIRQAFFWATHSGSKLDLLLMHKSHRYGFECKFSDTPTQTRSMHGAIEALNLKHLYVVHPGTYAGPLNRKISLLPMRAIAETLDSLGMLATHAKPAGTPVRKPAASRPRPRRKAVATSSQRRSTITRQRAKGSSRQP